MPSISRRRTNKNRALKRTRKIKSRRVRKNSQSAGGLFGSAGNTIAGFFKKMGSKTPKVSLKIFKGLKKRFSRKKNANNANAPLLNAKKESNPSSNPLANASPSASNSAGNSNANKAKNGNGNQANTGKAKQANNGKGNQPANGNGNKPKNGSRQNSNSNKQNTVVPPANTPVNAKPANKQTPPTNGGNEQNKKN